MKNNTDVSERIKKIIEYFDVNRNSFAKSLGYDRSQAVYDIINGKAKPSFDFFDRFLSSEYSDIINLDWIISEKGEMLKDKKSYSMDAPNVIEVSENPMSVYSLTKDYYRQEKQLIPLYDLSASAGLDMLFSDQSSQIPLDYISVPNAPKCDGALSIRGDSMYPILKSGDIACYKIIKKFDDIRFGEMYVLDIEDSSDQYLTAKYVQQSEKGDDFLKLVSENKYHAEKDQHKSHIRALALIKMYIRMNTIS